MFMWATSRRSSFKRAYDYFRNGKTIMDNDTSRRARLRSLSNRISGFLTRLERIKRPPNRRERYHLVEAMQHLYEGRSEEVEAALVRAEKIEPLPPHLTAQLTPSDAVTVANLREGLSVIRQQHEKG
jgi:hypothetical protein